MLFLPAQEVRTGMFCDIIGNFHWDNLHCWKIGEGARQMVLIDFSLFMQMEA